MNVEKVVIIGAGPAGISTAIQLKRYNIEPVLLEKDTALGEIVACKAINRVESLIQFRLVPAELHADATTAGSTLQHHLITYANCLTLCVIGIIQQAGTR